MKNKLFTKRSYDCKPTFIYETARIHKLICNNNNDLSFCSITCSICAYNYNLAKFLSRFLEPVVSTTNYTKDPFGFCEETSASDKVLVSYGIPSLFTNIVLNET